MDNRVGELQHPEIGVTVADVLSVLGAGDGRGRAAIDIRAVELARQYLAAHAPQPVPAATLEKITGIDRFTLTRHFRRAYGTSPDRYRTRRRLDLGRAAIEHGTPLAQAAPEAGFADQSHMTRQVKQAYGLTPARLASAVKLGAAQGTIAPEPRCSGSPRA